MPKRAVDRTDPVRPCVLIDRADAVRLDAVAAGMASTRSAVARLLIKLGLVKLEAPATEVCRHEIPKDDHRE
jgi:hypothetical protein